MYTRFIIAAVVVVGALSVLVYSALETSKREVVTVPLLVERRIEQKNIRLGARVADQEFQYRTEGGFLLRFSVRDPAAPAGTVIPVVYHGIMPDTLKPGRDVILEGDFDGTQFNAEHLMTQCPSKYEPPK